MLNIVKFYVVRHPKQKEDFSSIPRGKTLQPLTHTKCPIQVIRIRKASNISLVTLKSKRMEQGLQKSERKII